MSYTPNFNDPRTRKRTKQAMGFALAVLSPHEEHGWSQSVINKHFGHHGNELSKYLKKLLLTCTNENYSKDLGITKKYILRESGVRYLREVLSSNACGITEKELTEESDSLRTTTLYPSSIHLIDRYVVNSWCQREFGQDLKNLTFNYKDQSARLWHPLQNVKKVYKHPLFVEAGLTYQYDIQCCAPTLLLAHSLRCGNELYPTTVKQYIDDRQSIREQLAQEAEVPIAVVKVLINSLFSGAKLGVNPEFATSKILDHDSAKIKFLQQHPFIVALRADIRDMWKSIELAMIKPEYKTNKNGKRYKVPMSSKTKWSIYFNLERQVLNAARKYLIQTNNPHFLEHDGWTTQKVINESEIIDAIYQETGFAVKLDMSNLEMYTTRV